MSMMQRLIKKDYSIFFFTFSIRLIIKSDLN